MREVRQAVTAERGLEPRPPMPSLIVAATSASGAQSLGQEALPQRSPEHLVKDRRELLRFIARTFTGRYDLELLPGPNWAATISEEGNRAFDDYLHGRGPDLDELPEELFRPKYILYDEERLLQSPWNVNVGVLRHEMGHVKRTDFKLIARGQRQAIDDGNMPTTFASAQNALEDGWIDHGEWAESEVGRGQMQELYAYALPEVVEKINGQSLLRQLTLNLCHYYIYGKEIPTLNDERVKKAFEAIKPYADLYFCGATPQENYDLFCKEIWPEVRKLEDASVEDEKLKSMSRAGGGSKLGQGGQGQGSGGKGLWDKAKDAMRKAMGMKDPEASKDSKLERELRKELEKALSSKDRETLREEMQRQAEELVRADKELERQGLKPGALENDVDLSKLSPELLKKLAEARQNLPAELQKKLNQRAKENLDRKQAEALRKEGQRGLQIEKDEETGQYQIKPGKNPSERELNKARQQVQRALEEESNRPAREPQETNPGSKSHQAGDKELEQLREEGFEPEEAALYEEFKALEAKVRPQIKAMKKEFDEAFPKQEERFYEGRHYVGQKLNRRSLGRQVPTQDYRLFQQRRRVESPLANMYAVLLIDNSGSMAGPKMDAARQAAIAFARVLKQYDAPFAIKVFDGDCRKIKDCDQDYDDRRERIKPALMHGTTASGSVTNMGAGIEAARKDLMDARRRYPEAVGCVFVISDSGANVGLVGERLHDLISGMQKRFAVVNFILTDSEGEVAEAEGYFGKKNVVALPPERFAQLPIESGRVLCRVFRRFKGSKE